MPDTRADPPAPNPGPKRARAPFPPDGEDAPYFFVSYAHCDEAVVFSEMAWLREQGVRQWYDRGIDGGDDWEVRIYRKIHSPHCVGSLLFLSLDYLISKECRIEYRFMEDLPNRTILAIRLEDHEPRLRVHREFASICDLARAIYTRISVRQMLGRDTLDFEEYREHLLRSIPPAARLPHRRVPPKSGADRELVVRFFLGVRQPGETTFQPYQDGRPVAKQSRFKALVFAETDCHGALVIETFDKLSRRVSLDIHTQAPGGVAGHALRARVWDTLPGGGLQLEESHPDNVAEWRIGLVIWNADRSGQISRGLQSLRDAPSPPSGPDEYEPPVNERSIRLPLVTCKAFGLQDLAPAVSLEGRREMWHWIALTFV